MSSVSEEFRLLCAVYDTPAELLRKLGIRIVRAGFALLQLLDPRPGNRSRLHLVMARANAKDQGEIARRLSFYTRGRQGLQLITERTIGLRALCSREPVLVFGLPKSGMARLARHRPGTFDVDFHHNPADGWAWTDLAEYLDPVPLDLAGPIRRLALRISELRSEARSCAYVFGTGPSLEMASQRSWADGYRIVCNTVVRDEKLWRHLAPDFIVAGDAIYHFGFTSFARAFRRDLRERLLTSNAFFVYPSRFHAIVRNELDEVRDRLVPIPVGWRRRVDIDLTRSQRLPGLGNVLGLLLLPLACTLSKHVLLWGFDGRAPTDADFWSNSRKHSYPEYAEELRAAHPCFFEHFVPATDPNKYVRSVQGDGFDACLQLAEARGFQFEMMHPSWTPALQRRYAGEQMAEGRV